MTFNSNFIRRKIYKWLPPRLRIKLVRFFLPELKTNLDNIIFRPAETPKDYLAAFNLVYKVFVRAGYTSPSPTPFRLAPQHCNENSRVFIGMHKTSGGSEKLIYSISLFPDSKDGLPMDMVFNEILNDLRSEGRFLVEAGHLAADPSYKQNTMNIPMLGNKILHAYASEFLNADDIVIAVHPKYQWIYEDLLLFEKIGEVKKYSYANNNPAVAMRLDLNTMEERYKKHYKYVKKQSNLYDFFFKTDSASIKLSGTQEVDQPLLDHIKVFYGL